MSLTLYLDLETYCDLNLKDVGAYRYAAHPSFEITLMSFSYNGKPAVVLEGEDDIAEMLLDIAHPDITKVAHNAQFDRVALSALGRRLNKLEGDGFYPPAQWRDTMAQAAAGGYPRKLEMLAKRLRTTPKDTAGTHLINYFAKPYKGRRRTKADDPDRWAQFVEYARQDTDTLVEIDEKLDPLNAREQRIWVLDQEINDRGIRVDMPLAKWAEKQNEINSERASAQLSKILGVDNANSVQQVKAGMESIGLELDNLRAETIEEALERDDLTRKQRKALQLRQEISLTAAKKYTAAINMANDDHRFRGGFSYHGAVTGRWTGRGIQLQNLPRAEIKYPEAAVLDSKLGLGASAHTLKAMVRPMLLGPFVVSDFAAIEARVLAWIAGEQWALEAFRDDRDIYVETAQRMGGLTRQQGKVAVLALGYAGGVKSLRSMGAQGDDDELDQVKQTWRKANRNIAKLWRELDDAFDAGSGTVGSGRVAVTKKGKDRFVHLPSGRALVYRGVRRNKIKKTWPDGDTSVVNALHFQGDYGPVQTYGGKLTENVTQAIARDLLADSMLALEARGMRVVGHVHDEVIIEDPDSRVTVEEVERVMSKPPKWAKDLPLGAEGFRTYRYRKG